MTTVTKPLPPHGTYARANGCPGYRKPCNCEPCTTAHRAAKKRERVNRQLGRLPLRDASQARAKLNELHQTMGWNDIATAINGSSSHLRDIAFGRVTSIKQATHAKIMAVTPEPTGGQYVDATGSIRRVRALHAIGHTAIAIAHASDTNKSRIFPLLEGHPRLRRALAVRIEEAYASLSRQTGNNARARNRSRRESWAPPGAWDDDQIDDPDAHPDWTGHCGTDHGWWMHNVNSIPVCPRCETAHADWLADRKHLTSRERFRQLALAKGAASNRGANLAADARELMRVVGLTPEQVAERLAVTTSHLHHELKRHAGQELAA